MYDPVIALSTWAIYLHSANRMKPQLVFSSYSHYNYYTVLHYIISTLYI